MCRFLSALAAQEYLDRYYAMLDEDPCDARRGVKTLVHDQ